MTLMLGEIVTLHRQKFTVIKVEQPRLSAPQLKVTLLSIEEK